MDQPPADSQQSEEPSNGTPQPQQPSSQPPTEADLPQTQDTPKTSNPEETLVESEGIQQKPVEKSDELATLVDKKDDETPKLEEPKPETTSSIVKEHSIEKPKTSEEPIKLAEDKNDRQDEDESKGEGVGKSDEFHGVKPRDKAIDDADADLPKNVTAAEDKVLEAVSDEKEKKDGDVTHADTVKDENGFTYYKCRFCGLTYNYMNTLKAHERVHDIIQPYLCNKCGEAFHFLCEWEYHIKQHDKMKGYKCECGRTFYQYTELLNHRHPGEDDPVFDPNQIPLPQPVLATSSSSQILARSASVIDPSQFPVPDFAIEGYEPKHPLKVYSETRMKPYICQYCSKSYADSRSLAYHMYSHRGERSFNPRASRYLMCRNDNSYISPGADF